MARKWKPGKKYTVTDSNGKKSTRRMPGKYVTVKSSKSSSSSSSSSNNNYNTKDVVGPSLTSTCRSAVEPRPSSTLGPRNRSSQ